MHILQIIIKENFYGDKLDFKDIKFLVKVGDFRKIERKNSIDISLFGYEDGDLLLIGRGEKTPCSYQIFQYIHAWLQTTSWEKIFLTLLFTSF